MQTNSQSSPELPETIDILGKKFTVKLLNPDEYEDCDGYMQLETQTIGLRINPGDDLNHDTILHEIIHAVDEILLLKLRERQVHQLAVGLIAVLKQNKELAQWLIQ